MSGMKDVANVLAEIHSMVQARAYDSAVNLATQLIQRTNGRMMVAEIST